MLQQVCESIHNYFIKAAYPAEYVILNGAVSPALPLKEGQRFWLVGSDLNDGVYTYHADGIRNDDDTEAAALQDESFGGTVCAMAVPRDVITLSAEIADWVTKYGSVIDSPYTSESVIGVYSYDKRVGNTQSDGGQLTWQSQFASRMDRWRKVAL